MKARNEWISERAFTAQIIALARWYKWRVAHFRPAMVRRGFLKAEKWVTPVQGDGAGFPDLVLAHAKRGLVIFAELKTEKGRLSESQDEWLSVLRECQNGGPGAGVLVFVWKPSDIEEIEEILRGLK